jgi:dockerin type I repeat protein
MHRATLLVALGVTLQLGSVGAAALVVNPARPITHQVTIQTIQTALNNGTSPAPMFGDPTREAAIKATIDTVWAQAGIDVNFLPNVVRYNDTFAYQGLGVGVRPITDLNLMIGNASAQGGILNPGPSVINMFFVNVVPGFDAKASNWANGVGNIGLNGIAVFIGTSVSAEHAGHWLAHEIGHNLGLLHAPSGTTNLMTTNRNTELISDAQISAVFSTQALEDGIALIPVSGTGFPRPLSTQTPGDYDRSGLVDASDYALWRNTLNSTSNLMADGNKNGIVDSGDFGVWRSNFGRGFVTLQVLPGDYNLNGEVDAGDYAVWRSALGSTTELAADGNGNGIVDAADYTTWRSNFGHGSATAFEAGGEPQFAGQPGSPEPGSLALCIIAFAAFFLSRRR